MANVNWSVIITIMGSKLYLEKVDPAGLAQAAGQELEALKTSASDSINEARVAAGKAEAGLRWGDAWGLQTAAGTGPVPLGSLADVKSKLKTQWGELSVDLSADTWKPPPPFDTIVNVILGVDVRLHSARILSLPLEEGETKVYYELMLGFVIPYEVDGEPNTDIPPVVRNFPIRVEEFIVTIGNFPV